MGIINVNPILHFYGIRTAMKIIDGEQNRKNKIKLDEKKRK
jgi:hypothetical protein